MQPEKFKQLPDDRPGAYRWWIVVGAVIIAALVGLGLRVALVLG